jgi:hypothetical protein
MSICLGINEKKWHVDRRRFTTTASIELARSGGVKTIRRATKRTTQGRRPRRRRDRSLTSATELPDSSAAPGAETNETQSTSGNPPERARAPTPWRPALRGPGAERRGAGHESVAAFSLRDPDQRQRSMSWWRNQLVLGGGSLSPARRFTSEARCTELSTSTCHGSSSAIG